MKQIKRRDRLKIYGDLLSTINVESKNQKIVYSRIQVYTNLPHDRLKKYLAELKTLGLINDDPSLMLTEKGKEYLQEYKKVLEFIKRMGIVYR